MIRAPLIILTRSKQESEQMNVQPHISSVDVGGGKQHCREGEGEGEGEAE